MQRRRAGPFVGRFCGTAALVTWAALASAVQPPAPGADPYAACRERLARAPRDYESAYCFFQVTLDRRLWDAGARVFDELIARDPENPWLVLAYGHVHRTRNPDRAEALYRQAATAFQAAGNAAGEVVARSNLRNFLYPKGRVEDARREVERVVVLGETSPDPLVRAQAWTLEAAHVQDTGGDLGTAYRLLKQSEDALFPGGPYRLKRTLLIALGSVAFRMGRLDEALALYEDLDALAAEHGEATVRANARYNILNTSAFKETLLPRPNARERLTRMAERSLDTALAAQNLDATLKSHRLQAELLAADRQSRAKALEHANACLDLSVKARQPHDEAVCSWVLASVRRDESPDEARAAARRALDATSRANSPRTQAYSAGRHMRLSWQLKPTDEAVQDSLGAIAAIETLRGLQGAPSGAELFSTWTLDYYWLSGRLLELASDAYLDLAFATTERMRARSLLDALERSGSRRDPQHPTVVAHRAVLEAIAATQRSLMDPALAHARREQQLAELGRLERREQEAQHQVFLAFPRRATANREFATIASVQSALRDHEALLSYQVALWETYEGDFGGGAWLVALTRTTKQVLRLPDRAALEPVIPVFAGLVEGGSDEKAAAVRLYDDLLSGALQVLPSNVTSLIVIPDGALHRLPFDALRSAPDAPSVAERYELVVAPSATLWRQWRVGALPSPAGRVLTLADPESGAGSSAPTETRNAALREGLRLGRLPHAREESRAIQRHVGTVEALLGARASERALKSRDLRAYDIVHFAAHAIADEARPERSAVLLSAGGATEDGLLQAREIQGLDLAGRIVVLSACQTATGAVLSGEGVLSLARAFFEAGAHAVVGSRWPLRDEDAATLFESFYRHLSGGASLAQALKAAKREAIASGRPAAAWAGLVLLGNGDLRPFPGGRSGDPSATWPTATLSIVVAVLAAAAIAVGIRRRFLSTA